jgi:hypothetical protein
MKLHRILIFAPVLLVLFPFRASAQQENAASQLIAYYPLDGILTDVTGKNPPILAANAKFVASKAIFCNGVPGYGGIQEGCDVNTPYLMDLNLASFTISARFLVPKTKVLRNPVFVGGPDYRWLFYELDPDGGIRLGYNNNKSVECAVKYKYGFWHEAAITFDGKTVALYLDGIQGCSVNAALNIHNDKAIVLYNSSNATAFYGMLRALKVYNGVLVPHAKTPIVDTIAEPPRENLAPVDLILTLCPMTSYPSIWPILSESAAKNFPSDGCFISL